MDLSDGDSLEDLCALHATTSLEVRAAKGVLLRKSEAGAEPSIEDLVRLENAQATLNAIERQMEELATSGRG
jgi:hypothetical protein